MDTQPQVTEVAGPHRENFWTRTKKALGPLAAAGVIIAKFFAKLKFFILPALKFLPVILKSGGTMLLSIGIYASIWGWKFALGFVLLLFVHECGHLIVAKKFGLKVSAPVFIPFMGGIHSVERPAAQCMDGSLRWYWRSDARLARRPVVPFAG